MKPSYLPLGGGNLLSKENSESLCTQISLGIVYNFSFYSALINMSEHSTLCLIY